MDIKEVEKEYCSRCPSYKYGCGFITRGLQDKCAQLSDYTDGYERGYEQAKKDLLENKHETSWRLDEKLWKGIKDIEEASYQYMYDASNDWSYDIPTWKDVQDAFKAGSEWKEGLELSWKDIPEIFGISEELKTSWWFRDNEQTKLIGTQTFWEEVLKRFKERKENGTREG